MKRTIGWTLLFVVCCSVPLLAAKERRGSSDANALPSITEATQGMTAHEGLFRIWSDDARGKLWLELPPPGERGVAAELLYTDALRSGLGSNPVGLDRGQLGPTRWIALRRVGPRVLIEQLNPRFLADSDDEYERTAARESFATSVLWGGPIAALEADGRSLVDLTSFLIRDAHGIRNTLESTGQGSFALDADRSVVELDQCLAFPDNLELEATITFAGAKPGLHVRGTAPDAESITFVQHHSLIRLPDSGYAPRSFDPRAGSYDIDFQDYATTIEESVRRRRIVRHRLIKTDPSAERSPVVKPIVYYVDRGAPEPVRGALIEGAGWWAEAFERAGFIDGFRVELLPEGAHPLDVRYNVIEWVHRSTRGWSFGGGVVDPRTGEMLKGHVRLGSLRVRQDRLLFEGLAGATRSGDGSVQDPVQLALARIRQLAAHEVGHALGFAHNFAASTFADRASVMDYPAPLVTIDSGGELDLTRAYAVGVGAWDVHAAAYAYTQFPPGADVEAELAAVVRSGLERGMFFLTDRDARPDGAADPRANLWDNGSDPVAELHSAIDVRRHALQRFGADNLRPDAPLAELQEVLAPLYFHHRYQLAAALKVVGGMEYHYALRGDGQRATSIVPATRQREALAAILELLDPAELDLPETTLELLAPRANDGPNREMFASSTSPAFDALGAATTAAAMVIDGLLQHERLGRVADFHRRRPTLPGVQELLSATIDRVFTGLPQDERRAEIGRVVQSLLVDRLCRVAEHPELASTVRARVEAAIGEIGGRLSGDDPHVTYLATEISRFLGRSAPQSAPSRAPDEAPPGSPIGMLPRFADCGWDLGGR